MSEAKVRVWVITLHRFEHDEASAGILEFDDIRVPVMGAIMRRHNEVARLDGDKPPAEVARFMERWYASRYQPHWDEATSTPEERATMFDREIRVGHEPELVARLVDDEDRATSIHLVDS